MLPPSKPVLRVRTSIVGWQSRDLYLCFAQAATRESEIKMATGVKPKMGIGEIEMISFCEMYPISILKLERRHLLWGQ